MFGKPCLPSQRFNLTARLCLGVIVFIQFFPQSTYSQESQTTVGRLANGQTQTPVNQILTPYGTFLDLPGLRPQTVAVSPNGRHVVVSGKTNSIIVIDPSTGGIVQEVGMPGESARINQSYDGQDDKSAQVSYTGLQFSPDNRLLYLSNVNGSVKVFRVDDQGVFHPGYSIPLPNAEAARRKPEIPSGLALSGDGSRLYVCGNLSNRLFEIDTQSASVLRSWAVGVAPYDVVLVGDKAFVSNWGGRIPGEGDLTGPAGRGTVVRVDPVRHIASEGSVSVVDLAVDSTAASNTVEILTGLHASGLAVSPDQQFVVCANAAADTLSVIDVKTLAIVETIWAKANPADLLGASPNALAFEPSGKFLLVANGSQNAVGIIEFEPESGSELECLIPVGWYPGAIVWDNAGNRVHVANIKGLPESPRDAPNSSASGFNSHHYSGSLSTFQIPDQADWPALSERVARNLRQQRIAETALPPRTDVAARAIPERIGEPSLIKHVVYVIKENRTYDQVFGDIEKGRGNVDLCVFPRNVTPNQHKMVDQFVLLDNTYCAGILSADGHQWSTTAMSTDYMEKSFAGFPRSYPDGMGVDENDALAYASSGFIWDNALAHGISIRNYGEFMMPEVRYRDPSQQGTPDFLACYRTWQGKSNEVIFECSPSIESLREISPVKYVGWQMSVPDQYRADFVINELKGFEELGEFPQLTIICLPNDHASGTRPGCPTPAACIADNDLAFGRIVEALSHSSFWPEMAIFGIEDDPQAGWDHISGYRTTAYCISPYARRGELVSTQYNTTSVLRTIEQILGLPPMNQFDASATPMFDCFTDVADLATFDAVPSNIPLDQMNPKLADIEDEQLRRDALASMDMNFQEVDRAPEDLLNRILWRAMKGTSIAYPAWAAGDDDDEDEREEE
ncbi:MAG: beta-propeller fold lactonase family protein [Planctomycetales bacterium]|nr:beta-propeller fold lactonase family protein [Planctomycetales bacterium]